jgi:hypothetical protein
MTYRTRTTRDETALTADASKVSASEFINMTRAAFTPAPTETSERAAATYDYLEAIVLADRAGADDAEYHRIRCGYADALREIEARYRARVELGRAA